MTINACDASPNSDDDVFDPACISIGLCGEFSNGKEAHLGWDLWTVGYHGDDGKIFEEYGYGTYKTELLFGPGNTVKCGIDYGKGEYLFTLDGEVIGKDNFSPHVKRGGQKLTLSFPRYNSPLR